MEASDSGYVYVKNGIGPFTWHISSPDGGIWFIASGTSTLVTEERWAEVVSGGNNVCGTHTVTCTDDCETTVSGEIEGASGQWVVRMNGTSEWWKMDEFLVETGITSLPITVYHQRWFEALSDDYSGWFPVTHLAKIFIDRGDNDVMYEQPVGVAEYSVKRFSGVWTAEYICRAIADGPPLDPGVFPLPASIPTDVWPSDPEVSFDNINFVPDATTSIWEDGFGPGGYDPDSRLTLLYQWSILKAVANGVYTPGYTLRYQTEYDPVMWGYVSQAGSDAGCCDDGENCYQGMFSYLVYRQEVRIYDWVC
jgi:hypothetical protein